MRVTNFLLGIAVSSVLFSCKKDCDKPVVETPVDCTSWNKLLGGTQADVTNSSVKSPDGGYVIVGSTQSNDGDITGYHGGIDILVFKVDKNGNKVWQKAFGGTNLDIANSVMIAPDGGYIIAGYTMSTNGDVVGNHGSQDAWILKIDEQGNKIWQKTWGGSSDDLARASVVATGGYVIAVTSNSSNGDLPATNDGFNTWLIKLNTDGTVSWKKPIGVDFFSDSPSEMISVADGYVIAGSVSNATGWDARVVKANLTGDVVWQKTFGGIDQETFSGIVEGANGGYLLTGYTTSGDGDFAANTRGDYDLLAVKIDGNGNKVWLKYFEGAGVDGINGTSVIKTTDGHYVIASSTVGTNPDAGTIHGEADVWLVKLNGTGNKVSQKLLGGSKNDNIGNLIHASDCGYILAGWSLSNDGGLTGNHSVDVADVWISKIGNF